MAKLWAGRNDGTTAAVADDFNSSISFDSRMFQQDIDGSIAHATMLARQGILTSEDADAICAGLLGILLDLESGDLAIDDSAEDIHMFVEEELTKRIGDAGKRLHTARSRNDQVALDIRLYLRTQVYSIFCQLKELIQVLAELAEKNQTVIMPGYTHLQRAQPILLSQQLLAYAMMFLRDLDRLKDTSRRINVSPIGSCALAGTTYPTDRWFEAECLGFKEICRNSIDGVSDRDFCVEFLSDASLIMMHLSRLSEELVLWSSFEFGYISLSDGYTTGSSIMPQKKNPDMAELCRGKTGRVYGDLMSLLTVLKGLPLAYNKDMQEDKEPVFDAVDTLTMCLQVMTPMLREMQVHPEKMYAAAQKGFINATDLADYLVGKGMPFRDAYKVSGKAVALCIAQDKVLDTLPLEAYRSLTELAQEDLYDFIRLETCVAKRNSAGGTSPASVREQISYVKDTLSTL